MKRTRTLIFLCIALFSLGAFAQQPQQQQPPSGQGTPPATDQAGQGEHRQAPTVDEQVKRLSDRINLTDDQQAKAKTILEDQHAQAQVLLNDNAMSADDKRQKFMTLRQTTISKIRDILNDDQKKKFDAYLAEMQSAPKEKPEGSPKN
ncbi:MAG TPA: hypothetical protein VHA33_20755 [Candidatus Angelobacter sp.]|jgi:hypothetical protein|nr:hypothetical protein [Candidatus Angelobacter sp.]